MLTQENNSRWNPLMEKTKVIFIGAGGHAKVLTSILEATANELVAVFDPDKTKERFYSVKNEGDYSPNTHPEAKLLIAIGDNATRKKISQSISHKFTQAIHPSAQIDRLVKLGQGVQIMPSVVINRDTTIGQHSIINSNATVEHDCTIGDFVHIAPGATICGGVTVGEETLVGANATVLPNCIIGKNVIIGAGTVVTKNIPDNTVVTGIPGKIISNG